MAHFAEYRVNNVISINPEFNKPKKLVEYDNAKERYHNACTILHEFETNLKSQPLADVESSGITRSKLVEDVRKFEAELAELKKAFQYDRKNSGREYGRTLTPRSRNKVIDRMHFLYRKWREQPQAARFLWYTFTFTGWNDGRVYDPKNDDRVVADQFKRLLDHLKRFYGLSNYLWVAEPQTGKRKRDLLGLPTNAIHFHCVFIQPTDVFLNVQVVNFLWLTYLQQIGARTVSAEKVRQKSGEVVEVLGKAYLERLVKGDCMALSNIVLYHGREGYDISKERFKLANSLLYSPVDAEVINNPKKLTTYVAKYVTKNSTTDDKQDQDPDNLPPRPVYVNPWGCTRELANIKTRVALAIELGDYEAELAPHIFKTHVIRKELRDGKMVDLDNRSYDGFPPDVSPGERGELPDTAARGGFRKVFQFVRMVLRETVFELDYFKNLMADFTAQTLTLFSPPVHG